MIQARCFQLSRHRLTTSHLQFNSLPRTSRNFSSSFNRTSSRSRDAINSCLETRTPIAPGQWRSKFPSQYSMPRYASTSSASPPIDGAQPDDVPLNQSPAPAGEEFLSASLDDVTSSISPPVYEHLGFLKEMGLDYGWGPTAFVQTLLEHVHVYLGTPWWASITISMLIIRAALLKFYLDAADSSARTQLISHLQTPIQERIRAARIERDYQELTRVTQELKALRASAGISTWKSFMPLIQIPLGFGTFRLIRAMSYLPVPGFDTGGILWVKDLTLSDPYFILPIVTAAAYHFTFKLGGESGSSGLMTPAVRKIFLYVLPPMSGAIMTFWPGGLQLVFSFTAMIALIQSTLLRKAWFRRFFGIQPLPEPDATKGHGQAYTTTINKYQAPTKSKLGHERRKGILGAWVDITSAVSETAKAGKNIMQSQRKDQQSRLTAAELRHAKLYEEKRRKELTRDKEAEMNERHLAQANFERRQEEEEKERSRKEERLRNRAEKKAKQLR